MTETVRELVEASTETPRHLQGIYRFVHAYRPGTAEETIRARVYEAVNAGRLTRLAEGVYVARSGPATLLLIQGDARQVLASLDADSVDAIVTDGPYDLGTAENARIGTTRPHLDQGRGYEQFDFTREDLAGLFRVVKKQKAWRSLTGKDAQGGGAMFLFVPPLTRKTRGHINALIDLAESVGFVFYGSVTWDQETIGMGYDAGRNQKNDVLLFHAGERRGLLWDLGFRNVLRHKRLARREGEHEAEKPVGLFLDLLRAVTQPGDVVLDPFVGRGRWIRAALQEGRHVIAVDKDATWTQRIIGDFHTASL